MGATSMLLVLACGGRAALSDPNATPPSPPLPLEQVFLLESWGAPPEDTTVTFAATRGRVIVLRRGSPDNSLFATLRFPAGSLQPANGDSVTVRVGIRPGVYGFDLDTDGRFNGGAEVTFSYAIHFVAPAGARETYGSNYRLERFLAVGRVAEDSTLVFLDSWRPAADVLKAPVAAEGRYLVAAPRTRPAFRAIVW